MRLQLAFLFVLLVSRRNPHVQDAFCPTNIQVYCAIFAIENPPAVLAFVVHLITTVAVFAATRYRFFVSSVIAGNCQSIGFGSFGL